LPTTGDVSHETKHFENPDLGAAISKAEASYYEAAAPPPSVLAKAIKVVRQGSRQGGILTGPSAIVYILKRQRIFGLEVCTGWQIYGRIVLRRVDRSVGRPADASPQANLAMRSAGCA